MQQRNNLWLTCLVSLGLGLSACGDPDSNNTATQDGSITEDGSTPENDGSTPEDDASTPEDDASTPEDGSIPQVGERNYEYRFTSLKIAENDENNDTKAASAYGFNLDNSDGVTCGIDDVGAASEGIDNGLIAVDLSFGNQMPGGEGLNKVFEDNLDPTGEDQNKDIDLLLVLSNYDGEGADSEVAVSLYQGYVRADRHIFTAETQVEEDGKVYVETGETLSLRFDLDSSGDDTNAGDNPHTTINVENTRIEFYVDGETLNAGQIGGVISRESLISLAEGVPNDPFGDDVEAAIDAVGNALFDMEDSDGNCTLMSAGLGFEARRTGTIPALATFYRALELKTSDDLSNADRTAATAVGLNLDGVDGQTCESNDVGTPGEGIDNGLIALSTLVEGTIGQSLNDILAANLDTTGNPYDDKLIDLKFFLSDYDGEGDTQAEFSISRCALDCSAVQPDFSGVVPVENGHVRVNIDSIELPSRIDGTSVDIILQDVVVEFDISNDGLENGLIAGVLSFASIINIALNMEGQPFGSTLQEVQDAIAAFNLPIFDMQDEDGNCTLVSAGLRFNAYKVGLSTNAGE
jgi:hypothetical protein